MSVNLTSVGESGDCAALRRGVALGALHSAGVATLASVEFGTDGALLAILSGHERSDGEAAFRGGVLVLEDDMRAAPADADAVLTVRLAAQGALGRSRVTVSLEAPEIGFETRVVRIHGSGQQRLRRAAFAALDVVRRARV